MYSSYGLPYISTSSYKSVHHLRTVKYSLQKASRDMVIDWNKDNVQVTPLFNAHRNYAEKISQKHSHFRSSFRKCLFMNFSYWKDDTKWWRLSSNITAMDCDGKDS